MSRISSGSCLVEINIFDPAALIKVIEGLLDTGISRVGVTLEPSLVYAEAGDQQVALAIGPLALMLEQCEEGLSPERAIRITKNAWIKHISIGLRDLATVLRSLITCNSISTDFARIVTYGSCPVCEPVIVETLSLKYPYRPPIKQAYTSSIRSIVTNALKKGMVVLLACIRDGVVEPLVWLDTKASYPAIYVCCASEQQTYAAVIQSLLDAIVSMAKHNLTTRREGD